MNYVTNLYDPYKLFGSNAKRFLLLITIVFLGFFFTACAPKIELPKWLGGPETAMELAVKVAKLEADLQAAHETNKTLNGQLREQRSFEIIEDARRDSVQQEVKQVEVIKEVVKVKTVTKIKEIEARPDLSEQDKDLETLKALIQSSQDTYAQIPSVKANTLQQGQPT